MISNTDFWFAAFLTRLPPWRLRKTSKPVTEELSFMRERAVSPTRQHQQQGEYLSCKCALGYS